MEGIRLEQLKYVFDKAHLEIEIPSVGGVMVSIDAFQALDPGSIPGHRIPFLNQKSFVVWTAR